LCDKFDKTGSTLENKTGIVGHKRTARTEENINKVKEFIKENPNQPISKASQQLGLKKSSLRNILVKDLAMHPYKITILQKIPESAFQKRNAFCIQILQMISSGKLDPNLMHLN